MTSDQNVLQLKLLEINTSFRMCKYVNTNLPILLDATLHKLTDCNYPLNPRKSECDSPGFPHCLSNIYPEVENEEANLRTTFGST